MKLTRIITIVTLVTLIAGSISYADFNESTTVEATSLYDLREKGMHDNAEYLKGGDQTFIWSSIAALEGFLYLNDDAVNISSAHQDRVLSGQNINGLERKEKSRGYSANSIGYYTSWMGAVTEKDEDNSYDKYHVQGITFIPERQNPLDNDLMKECITEYGGVVSGLWVEDDIEDSKYLHKDNMSWYMKDKTSKNGHYEYITIIGWDDNYPKAYFNDEPEGDGAFIAVYSKSVNKDVDSNCIYISYYDNSLMNELDYKNISYAFNRVDEPENYDHIYQHDTFGMTNTVSGYKDTAYFANIFNVYNPNKEQLSAVSFYTFNNDITYEIYYKGDYRDKNDLSDLVKIKEGSLENPGYHTIDIEGDISLTKGQYAVAVKLIAKEGTPLIAVESKYSDIDNEIEAAKGESYIYNRRWQEAKVKKDYANVCLKAFTFDLGSELLSVDSMMEEIDFIYDLITDRYELNDYKKSIFANVQDKIVSPLTKQEFYFIVNELFTMLGDKDVKLYNDLIDNSTLDLPIVYNNKAIKFKDNYKVFKKDDRIVSIGNLNTEQLVLEVAKIDSNTEENLINCIKSESVLKGLGLVNEDNTIDIVIERKGKLLNARHKLIPKDKAEDLSTDKVYIDRKLNLGYFLVDESIRYIDENENLKGDIEKFFKEVLDDKITNVVFDFKEDYDEIDNFNMYLSTFIDDDIINIDPKYEKQKRLYDGRIHYVYPNIASKSNELRSKKAFVDNQIVYMLGNKEAKIPTISNNLEYGKLPNTKWKYSIKKAKELYHQEPIVIDERVNRNEAEVGIVNKSTYTTKVKLNDSNTITAEMASPYYVRKFEYLVVNTEDILINNFDKNLFTMYDSRGNEIEIIQVVRGSSAHHVLLVMTIVDLPKGDYTLFIKPGAVQFETTKLYNSNDIELEFRVNDDMVYKPIEVYTKHNPTIIYKDMAEFSSSSKEKSYFKDYMNALAKIAVPVEKLKSSDGKVIRLPRPHFVEKRGYLLLRTNGILTTRPNKDLFEIFDSNGEGVKVISIYTSGSKNYEHRYTLSVKKGLEVGNYTLYIAPGGVKYEDGTYNSNPLYLPFLVEEED